jgi:predicted nucleotidyltransferase
MATARSEELRALAQSVADALPADVAEEVVVTGSVSRGLADELSDVEMLIVTPEPLELEEAFAYARAAELEGELETWGDQSGPGQKVFGYFEGVPFELIWWPRDFAEEQVEAMLAGKAPASADAFLNGVALRSAGLLPDWQERLREVPEEVAATLIEDAALPWGGFAPAGVLTLIRRGERLELVEWLVDSATRVLTIVYSLNRVWQPAPKRLPTRIESLAIKPDRLVERITEALTDLEPRTALLTMTELQLDAVNLAPDGPNIVRAREWLAASAELLRGE